MIDDALLQRLTKDIPPFPAIADKVLHLARQTPIDFRQIARLVETDPALSALIVRMANSPLYGSFRNPVETLDRAMVVLGQKHIIDSTVIYITRTLRKLSKSSWGTGELAFWKHSIGVAVAARMLARKMDVSHAQQCFLAGLMHDIGKIPLMAYDPAGYKETIKAAQETNRPLYYAELENFGITHTIVGREICKNWYLPITTTKAVAYHHDDPDTITLTVSNLVRSGDLFTKIARIGDGGNPFALNAKKLLIPHPQFTEQHVITFMSQLVERVDEMTGFILEETNVASPPFALDFLKDPALRIQILISNEADRLTTRYVLHELGYNVSTMESLSAGGSDTTLIKIVDRVPHHVAEHEHIIDFGAWKKNQEKTIEQNELNIMALHHWLETQLRNTFSLRAA